MLLFITIKSNSSLSLWILFSITFVAVVFIIDQPKTLISKMIKYFYSLECPWYSRSSHPEVLLGKGVLKICSKFTGEHPCRSNFIEITLRHGCYPVNVLHTFRIPFIEWLFLIFTSWSSDPSRATNKPHFWNFEQQILSFYQLLTMPHQPICSSKFFLRKLTFC